MKTVIITGAGGDIGQSITQKLISAHWRVCGFDKNEERLEACRKQVSNPERFEPIHCDVTSTESVTRAVNTAREKFGDIHSLVNNAGAISSATLLSTSEKDWLGDIDLNLNGPWRCIHALQDNLIKQDDAVIVNIASINGLGVFGHPGYSVAKAGLIHLTRFCASEFGKYGVRAVAICPGTVKTKAWKARLETDPTILDKAIEWYPSRGLCEPEDVANAVEMVMQPCMKQLNGAVISLDGGLTAGSDRVASAFAGTDL